MHDPLAREIAGPPREGRSPRPRGAGTGARLRTLALAIGRPSSENPIAPASHSSAISVSSSPSIPRVTLATNPTGIEASRSARFRTEREPPPSRSAARYSPSRSPRNSRPRPPSGSRLEVLLVLLARDAEVDVRVDERRPRAGRSHRRPRPCRSRAPPGSASSAISPLRTTRSRVASMVRGSSRRAPRTISVAAGAGRLVSEGASGRLGSVLAHAHAGCPIVGVSGRRPASARPDRCRRGARRGSPS